MRGQTSLWRRLCPNLRVPKYHNRQAGCRECRALICVGSLYSELGLPQDALEGAGETCPLQARQG